MNQYQYISKCHFSIFQPTLVPTYRVLKKDVTMFSALYLWQYESYKNISYIAGKSIIRLLIMNVRFASERFSVAKVSVKFF